MYQIGGNFMKYLYQIEGKYIKYLYQIGGKRLFSTWLPRFIPWAYAAQILK
jgi:hypothetical protein